MEKRGRQVAPELLATPGAESGAHDDLGACRAHLLDLVQSGGVAPGLAPALLRGGRVLAGAAADVFAYMDEDVELWRKRYSWEQAADNQWQHYIDDLSAFFAFLDTTESVAMEMARQRGIVR